MSERFTIHGRVRLTEVGRLMGLQGRASSDCGTVTSIRQGGMFIMVLRDGLRTSVKYAVRFWVPIEVFERKEKA